MKQIEKMTDALLTAYFELCKHAFRLGFDMADCYWPNTKI